MASIVDSFREVVSDRLAVIKLLVFGLPLYFAYSILVEKQAYTAEFYEVFYITLFFLFGFLIKMTNNVINERNVLLPSLNPLNLAFSSLKGLIAIGISSWVTCSITGLITSAISILPWLDITLKTILWLLAASIILSSFLMFCQNENILEAFKPKLVFEKAGDLIFVIVFFIIKLILMNLPTFILAGYILYFLFGAAPIFVLFVMFALVFNLAVTGHYLGQVHYEQIGTTVSR